MEQFVPKHQFLFVQNGSYLENGGSFVHVVQHKHSSLLVIHAYRFLIGKTFGVEFKLGKTRNTAITYFKRHFEALIDLSGQG